VVIAEVKRIRDNEEESALDQIDKEHVDRMQSVEHRIADLLVKRRKAENYQEKTKVGGLEDRVDSVADSVAAVNDEKNQQSDLIKSLKDSLDQQKQEMAAQLQANTDHIVQLAADEASRLVLGHSILPPEGSPLPSDVKGTNPFSDVVHAGGVAASELKTASARAAGPPVLGPDAVEADVVPSTPQIIEVPVAVAIPVAIASPDMSVRPEIRN